MPKISVEEVSSYVQKGEGSGIGFFSLKNDKDFAYVRILHEKKSDFDIQVIHRIQINGKDRNVSCLRTSKDPIDVCPLCNKGEKVGVRFYVHLLQYSKDEAGKWKGEHKVFERSSKWIEKILEYATTYQPLHETVFKVIRIGKSGDLKTDYSFMPIPNVSNEYEYFEDDLEFAPVNETQIVLEKTADQLKYYLSYGKFPDEGNPIQSTQSNVEPKPINTQPNATQMPLGPRRRV